MLSGSVVNLLLATSNFFKFVRLPIFSGRYKILLLDITNSSKFASSTILSGNILIGLDVKLKIFNFCRSPIVSGMDVKLFVSKINTASSVKVPISSVSTMGISTFKFVNLPSSDQY